MALKNHKVIVKPPTVTKTGKNRGKVKPGLLATVSVFDDPDGYMESDVPGISVRMKEFIDLVIVPALLAKLKAKAKLDRGEK